MPNENGTWIMYGVSWNDPECLHSVDEAIDYINEVGFLPLFKNDIPGFSIEERTVPKYWWCGDSEVDPWEWRELIARSGKVAYGKFFDKKAGFISKKWLPYFVNVRRDGYDFDALWEDGKASAKQRKNKLGEEYGWPIAIYCTPEHLWGYKHVTKAYSESPQESADRIMKYMNEVYPIATEKQIKKIVGLK